MGKKNGYTLLELLAVISIIGIILSVGSVSYSSFQKKAQDARRKSDIEIIRSGLEQFRSNNNRYPLTSEITWGGDLCDPFPGSCASGTYLRGIPQDPTTSNTYFYQQIGSSDYMLGTCLKTGGTSSCGNCGPCPAATACNYCMGPYGKR